MTGIRFGSVVSTVSHSPLSGLHTCYTLLRHTLTLTMFLLILQACVTTDDQVIESLAYHSVWSQLYPGSLRRDLPANSLQGEFLVAATAETPEIADERWTKFLSDWEPPDGAYEDAMHARLVDWAKLEMQRLQHLLRRDPSAMEAVTNKLMKLAAESE